jgi:hypothetical protein
MVSDVGNAICAKRLNDLRTFAAYLTDHHEQRGCGRVIRKGPEGSSGEVLDVTTSCKRKWHCPVCAYRASKVEARTMERRLLQWTSKGGQVAFLTLTQAHKRHEPLDVLWSRLEAGWRSLMTCRAWERDKACYGIRGFQRVTEIVYSDNGWHPHYHVILLLDRAPDNSELERMRTALATRFIRGVVDGGGRAELPCQDLRANHAQDCHALASYCFKGLTIHQFSSGSRTPMAILNDLEARGEEFELWSEFNDSAHKGRRQTVPSHGIESICAAGPYNS